VPASSASAALPAGPGLDSGECAASRRELGFAQSVVGHDAAAFAAHLHPRAAFGANPPAPAPGRPPAEPRATCAQNAERKRVEVTRGAAMRVYVGQVRRPRPPRSAWRIPMSLSSITRLGACALLVLASGAASAQSSVGVGVQIGGEPVVDGDAINPPDRPATHPFCLRTTGSRIPPKARQVDADRDGKPDRVACMPAHGRVYTRHDLDTTGAIDLADALRRLDPSIR
jgi:hypothetical protein